MSQLPNDQAQALAAARTLISQERAKEIRALRNWQNGGVLGGNPKPDIPEMTDAENEAIRELWKTLDGSSCWMSALHLLCNQSK